MPDYTFTAYDSQGNTRKGKRNAASSEDLAGALMAEGLSPLDIVAIDRGQAKNNPTAFGASWFKPKVSKSDLHIFCRQMYTLLKAGIPINMAVTRVAETSRNKTLIEVLIAIGVILNKGSALSVALGQFPKIFSELFVSMVKVGENTGTLDTVFLHLTEYLELEVDIHKKVKSAMRYPIMVICAISIAMVVINFFVIPTFAKLYSTMKGELPLPTRILVGTSNFMVDNWLLLALGLAALIWGTIWYIHTSTGRLRWGKLQIKLPIVGRLVRQILLGRFARLLSLVLRAGMPAIDGIKMVSESTANYYVADKINQSVDLIVRGNSISAGLDKAHLFPPLVIQMIAIGEESGSIDTLLEEVANYYQRETDYDINRLSESMEPLLLAVVGGMVLVLALGVFLPMWNMASLYK